MSLLICLTDRNTILTNVISCQPLGCDWPGLASKSNSQTHKEVWEEPSHCRILGVLHTIVLGLRQKIISHIRHSSCCDEWTRVLEIITFFNTPVQDIDRKTWSDNEKLADTLLRRPLE